MNDSIISDVSSELVNNGLNNDLVAEAGRILKSLLSLERNFLSQLSQNHPQFLKDYAQSSFGAEIFQKHEELVSSIFGQQSNFAEASIDDETFHQLVAYLQNLKSVKQSDYVELQQTLAQTDPLLKILPAKEKMAAEDANIVLLHYQNDHPNQRLCSIMRQSFTADIRAPFAFVNARAWITKPNAMKVGANSEHTDHFLPGHMKIMVYLTPLNRDFGYFVINGEEVREKEAGTAILFRNSDIRHRGVPGTKFPRICIELTLQRTLLNSDQSHQGHPIGRHNYCLASAYNGGTLKI